MNQKKIEVEFKVKEIISKTCHGEFNNLLISNYIEKYYSNKHLLPFNSFLVLLKTLNNPLHIFITELLATVNSEDELIQVIIILELVLTPQTADFKLLEKKSFIQDYSELQELKEKSIILVNVVADLKESLLHHDQNQSFKKIQFSLTKLNSQASRYLQQSKFKLKLLLLKTAINKSEFNFSLLN